MNLLTNRQSRSLIIAATATVLVGCAAGSSDRVNLVDPANLAAAQHMLDSGDSVFVQVENFDAIDDQFFVTAGGDIELPRIGKVAARGVTIGELGYKISKALQEGQYLDDAVVAVEIADRRDVYINGAVESPGAYPFVPNFSLGDLLVLAGGGDLQAGQYEASVVRVAPQNKLSVGLLRPADRIMPGDVINIELLLLVEMR